MSSVHYMHDVRIFYKECVSSINFGFPTYLVIPGTEIQAEKGVNILSVKRRKERLSRFFLTCYQVYKKALSTKAHIYHFHDPELIPWGIILKLKGKKVIYDVHEDLPESILGKKWLFNSFIRKSIAWMARRLEGIADRYFDGIVAVIPSIAKRFRNPNTILLRNVPIISLIDAQLKPKIDSEVFKVVYAGGLTYWRGIRQAIKAIGILDGSAELILMGRWDDLEYEELCKQEPGFQYTKDLGFVLPEVVYQNLAEASAGLVTLLPQENYLESYPVKAFEYLAAKVPMIMSDFPFWKDLFDGVAVFVDPFDPEEIAKAILRLKEDEKMAQAFQESGRKLVTTSYSWDVEQHSLKSLYLKIGDTIKNADGGK